MPVPAAAAGASYLGAGATLLSGLMNYKAAQSQNDLARNQFAQNLQFQRYQYEDSKRFNSYENQVRMMRRAGLNPSIMFGGGASAVSNSQVGGISPTASAVSPDYSFLPSSLVNVGQAISQASLNSSTAEVNRTQSEKNVQETQGQRIDNLYKDDFWKSSNYLRQSQAWLFDKQADIQKLSFEYDRQSMGDRLFEQRWKSELTRAQTEASLISNAFLPERCREEINSLITNQKVALQQGVASIKSAMAAVMSAVNQQHAFDAQFGGTPALRNQFFNATLKSLEQSIRLSKSNEFKNISGVNPLPFNLTRFEIYDNWQKGKLPHVLNP